MINDAAYYAERVAYYRAEETRSFWGEELTIAELRARAERREAAEAAEAWREYLGLPAEGDDAAGGMAPSARTRTPAEGKVA